MFRLPFVSRTDFPALKAAMGPNLPDNYEDWLSLSAILLRENRAKGVLLADVDPDEFASYMGKVGRSVDMGSLLEFAASDPLRDLKKSLEAISVDATTKSICTNEDD
jgi:hypothetical protein